MTAISASCPVAVLDTDIRNSGKDEWSHRVDRIDCYGIGSIDLMRYAALIIRPSVDQEHLAGAIVVSTLDPISHYGGYFMPATGRFLDAFLPWAAGAWKN